VSQVRILPGPLYISWKSQEIWNFLFGTRLYYSFLYSHEGREVAMRRGNGEGSVYRRKDGLWVGQYKIQTSSGTKTKYIYSKTRKEASTKLARAIADRDSGYVFD
jgi:hypothetical protein